MRPKKNLVMEWYFRCVYNLLVKLFNKIFKEINLSNKEFLLKFLRPSNKESSTQHDVRFGMLQAFF